MTEGQFCEIKAILHRSNRWAAVGFTLALLGLGGGCFALVEYRSGDKVSRSEYVALLDEVKLLRRDNRVMYFLLSIATDENNAERAKTEKKFEDFKKANGLDK